MSRILLLAQVIGNWTWYRQEPINRSMQLHYIPVKAFSVTDRFIFISNFPWKETPVGAP